MKEELVTFETAKLAKEKGLTAPIMATSWYNPSGIIAKLKEIANCENYKEVFYYAPTQSLLQKWLREVHNIHIGGEVRWNNFKKKELIYEFWIKDMREVKLSSRLYIEPSVFSYEEALEKGLQEALKLIKK